MEYLAIPEEMVPSLRGNHNISFSGQVSTIVDLSTSTEYEVTFNIAEEVYLLVLSAAYGKLARSKFGLALHALYHCKSSVLTTLAAHIGPVRGPTFTGADSFNLLTPILPIARD